jgi:subtilase family serine protease
MDNRYKVIVSVIVVALFVASVMVYGVSNATGRTGIESSTAPASTMSSGQLVQMQGASINGQLSKFGNFQLVSENSQFNPNAQLVVTLSLKPTGNLSSYVSAISNPDSAMYRQYTSAAGLGNMFGVSQQAYSSIVSYFSQYGLNVQTSPARLSLTLVGTVSQFESAFDTQIGAYAIQYTSDGVWMPLFGNGSAVPGSVSLSPVEYVNTAGLNMPAGIAQYVSGVTGLDGMAASPDLMLPYGMSPSGVVPGLYNSTGSTVTLNSSQAPGSINNPYDLGSVQNITDANYTWAPNYLTPTDAAFNDPFGNYQFIFPSTMHVLTGASNLWSGQSTIASEPDMGQGVTVAVIEVGDLPLSWLQGFAKEVWNNPNQITSRLSVVNLLGANLFDGEIYGWTLETALDIEYVAAMAPAAHIDLVAVPNPQFSSFDYAYQYIAQNLVSGNNATDSISITSNSYGSGEEYTAFFGSPMYMTVENTLLSELNAVGVTNFFASGDYGSYAAAFEYGATSAGMPAIATGSTSVGGGQLTAESNGVVFPETGIYALNSQFDLEMQVAPATGVESYTYWSYGFGEDGTFKGFIGGGFGQSIMSSQPWWQNALDTYSSGARMDPVVSGPAAFNMSVYTGFWNLFYGGTSFATPITAGEWALIDEQANVAFGSPSMGDINPTLYQAHNAYEAGMSSVHFNPYIDMQNIGKGFNYGPTNSFDWYYFNLSINEPSDPIVPWWIFTLGNPAGNNWNYLQGLGMINVGIMDSALIGQVPSTQHALMNEPFTVMALTPSGPAQFETLVGGTTYTFQVILANGQPGGYYTVEAYSGGPNNGMYGGGTVTQIHTNAQGMFNYTPVYNMNSPSPAASEYGYFLVSSVASSEGSFQQFAVVLPPVTSGNLTLGVTNALGMLETSVAEVPMFMDTQTGYYNLIGATGEVFLNGTPVSNAVVHEVSVSNAQFSFEDPTLPVSSYAPGVQIGTFLSDGRGMFNFWTDAFLAEINGPLYTQVEMIYATYGNLTSNMVTVYIEPQSGSFYPNIGLNSAGTALVGTVTFSDMKYVNYVNISIGSEPGQYVNVSYPPQFVDSLTGVPVSGVFNGVIPVNFTNLPPAGTPIVVNMVAQGYNDLSLSFSFFGFTFAIQDVQNPIVWSDPLIINNPGAMPATVLSASQTGLVNGNLTLSYSASSETPLVSSSISVASAAGQHVVSQNLPLKGTLVINTADYPDGYYTITYSVTTSTGLVSTSQETVYIDNTQAQLETQIASLEAEYSSAIQQLNTLKAELSQSSVSSGALQSQIATLNQTIREMSSSLASAESQENLTSSELLSAETQLLNAEKQNGADQQQIQQMNSEISQYKANATAQQNTIASLQQQIANLQQQINSLSGKNNDRSPFYYIGGIMAAVIVGIVAAVASVSVYSYGRQKKKN